MTILDLDRLRENLGIQCSDRFKDGSMVVFQINTSTEFIKLLVPNGFPAYPLT